MSLKKFYLHIGGMTCQACEVTVERRLKEVPNVEKVSVNHRTGKAEIVAKELPPLGAFQEALADEPYEVRTWRDKGQGGSLAAKNDHAETGAIALLVFALWFFLSRTGMFSGFGLSISSSMSYGFVFVLGIVAALSTCIAVTGGLLVAISAKYNEQNPGLPGIQKFKPHILFNAGRLVSYTFFGGVIGAVGSVLAVTSLVAGYMTIGASVVMVVMALNMLKVPGFRRLSLRLPKSLSHRIHDAGGKPGALAPMLLGAATFFLPCGFTQSLQIYALSTGSFAQGALTMFMFALGTLPALVGLGAVSSFAKGDASRLFVKFAGVLVLIIGFGNISNGLTLTGGDGVFASAAAAVRSAAWGTTTAPDVKAPMVNIENGEQVLRFAVDGTEYVPNRFTVYEDKPVKMLVEGKRIIGCSSVLTIPQYGITKYLQQGAVTEISFTPSEPGEIRFTCSMGMTDGRITVLPRES